MSIVLYISNDRGKERKKERERDIQCLHVSLYVFLYLSASVIATDRSFKTPHVGVLYED